MYMKTFNVNCRMDDDLRDVVDVIKLRKGGLTEFFQDKLREEREHVTVEEWTTLRRVRRMAGK